MTDEQIIIKLKSGNEKALEAIFKKYNAGLIFWGHKYLPEDPEVSDIAAEAFVKLWERRTDFDSIKAIKAWLYTTVKNTCINQIKTYDRHEICHEEIRYMADESEEMYNLSEMIRVELLSVVYEQASKLPPARRKIFDMLFKEGLSTGEVAKVLKISIDTVRVQKARAINTIKSAFPKGSLPLLN